MKWTPLLVGLLVVLIVAGHLWFLLDHFPPAYSGPDANGYFAQAAFLANHGTTELEPASGLSYVGMHWLETPDGRFFSRYPPGVGILVAVPYWLLGPEAGLYLQPVLASLTLLFLFLLCRPYTGSWLALLAVGLYAMYPLANSHALNWGAHTPAAFLLVAGLWLLDSWSRSPAGWPARWRVFMAGLLLGALPAMRYAEVVAGVGVVVFLVYQAFRLPGRKADLLIALAGAAIPVGLLMLRNYTAFGSPFETGYALTGEQQLGTGFGMEFLAEKWRPFLTALMSSGMGLFFAFGLAGMVAMMCRKNTLPMGMLLFLVVAAITVTYAAYYWGAGGGRRGGGNIAGLRFLLPTLPLYLLPALWFFREHHKGMSTGIVLGVVALVQAGLWLPETLESSIRDKGNLARVAMVVQGVREHAPEGSVVIADRRLNESLQYYRWQLLDSNVVMGGRGPARGFDRGGFRPAGFDRGQDVGDTNAPARAMPMQRAKARKLREKYENAISDRQRYQLIVDDLYDLAGDREVFWVGRSTEVRRLRRYLRDEDSFQEVGKIELPADRSTDGSPRRWGRGRVPGAGPGAGFRRQPRGPGPGGGPGFGPRPGATYKVYKLVRQ
jgi:hypothetical protein